MSGGIGAGEGLAGTRVLVTGASGRIGRVTTALLNDCGARVTALSANEEPALEAERVLVGDTRSEADVADALQEVEAVVHLAALAHRDIDTPYNVYTTNVVSTFNVLAQAGAAGIRRAVVASSINAYGVPMNHHEVTPAYYPLDSDIPVDIDDWYSLSKYNDEQTARMAWRHWGIDVVSLRFPYVNDADAIRQHSERLTADPAVGVREGWSYLDSRDAARALALGITAEFTGAHRLFIAADSTCVPYPTADLLNAFAADTPKTKAFIGREVPIDLSAVRALLGFRAEHEIEVAEMPLPPHLA
ncbi:NAD(P)-dependent oxidoreductase [Microlunatus panaciterrae]|uniref:Nucleoside-diphosphate-sugar epimerase n=1 Tax=Microlunatus panaciterrae TaxID=400768 RepID=A0ABS2RFR7_9ACTN|nr:NAD(P)-dependent oxidoreductase [Microlunatus panaciterrae]MBM7797848.1 nucleoside-diphosphate-sugar epimerase [Microlunatus panaciterrae]